MTSRAAAILALVLGARAFGAAEPNPEEAVAGSPGWLRDKAYAAAGEGFIRCLKGARFPSSGPLGGPEPFLLDIDWKRQADENLDAFPYCGWSALDYGSGTVGAYTIFNLKYLAGTTEWFDYYFSKIPTMKYLKDPERRKIMDNESEIRNKSLVFFLAFRSERVRFVFYPGDRLFHGGLSTRNPWLSSAPDAIREGRRTDHKLIQSGNGLVAIMNGTFLREDNFSLFTNNECRFGGFGFDFRPMEEPEPGMGTVAIYGDGALRLGSWRNLPDRDNIRIFVQNKYMVLEDGRYGRDASPPHFTRFDDMIARSYLFRHSDGWTGYMWTMNTPPQVAARLARDMRVRDMIILDIHSTIGCQVSVPGAPPACTSHEDFRSRSFNFVPLFDDATPLMRSAMAVARAIRKRIQPDYRLQAFRYGEESYFAVFLEGSPEAARISWRMGTVFGSLDSRGGMAEAKEVRDATRR